MPLTPAVQAGQDVGVQDARTAAEEAFVQG
jgi:hypothetical protein